MKWKMTSYPTTWGELKNTEFKQPKIRVDPWMHEGALCMLHSWRGVGKTLFSLGLSQAIASNSPFLKWGVSMGRVFYFDCEMGNMELTGRLAMFDRAAKFKMQEDTLRTFSFEHMGGVTWNLACPEAQQHINKLMGDDTKLLVIDNLSAACKTEGREDYKTAYSRFRDWLLDLKTRGISVLIVHHSGKEGRQRGISDIEDPLDIVIQLRRPESWKITDGSIFEFHFEKTRCLSPADPTILEPIQIEVRSINKGKDIEWFYSSVREKEEEKKNQEQNAAKSFRKPKKNKGDTFNEPPF